MWSGEAGECLTHPGGGWIDSLTVNFHSEVEAETIEQRDAKETSDRTVPRVVMSMMGGAPCLEIQNEGG